MSDDKGPSDKASKSIGERMRPPKEDSGVGRLKLKGGMVLKKSGKKKRTWKKVDLEKHVEAGKSQEDLLDARVKKKHDKFC